MVSYETIERALHRLDHRFGSLSVNDGTLRTTATFTSGTISVDKGTVNIDFSTIPSGTLKVDVVAGVLTSANPTDGTLSIVTQIGTLPNIVVGSGTLQEISGAVTIGSGTVQISDGTLSQLGTLFYLNNVGTVYYVDSTKLLGTLNSIVGGTIDYLNTITQIGTLPNLVIGSGTIEVSGFSGGVMGISDGTLTSLPNIIVGSGTLQEISGPVAIGSGTVQISGGTLNSIPNVVVGSGTLQAISENVPVIPQSGTLQQITNCYLAGAGTVNVASGTINIDLPTVPSGTLKVNVVAGTLTGANPTDGTLSSVTITGGTLNANGTVTATGTLSAIIESGTLTSLGSANIYSKHDLHVYDALGTIVTAVGTLIQTASKIIKVHQYSIMTDGTLAYSFNDAAPNGGTVDCGGVFYQREGREKPFIPYPGYHFKTSTVGSALCLGTYAPGMSGTAYIHIVYTDDDTA